MRRISFFLSSVRSYGFLSNRIGAVLMAKSFRVFHFQENAIFFSRQQKSYFSSFKNSNPAPFSSTAKKENKERKRLEVEIISKENIKPASPTPHNLKTYKVSILDQVFPKNLYMSFVYFYENNHVNNHDIISKRRQILKQSLSEILTRFYPLAGKVHDTYIDCNDEGVYYVEAKVNDHLSEFVNKPDNKSIHQLLPFDPVSLELLSQTFVVMIQVTVFGCGGIAIGIYTSHKIIDGYSLITFFKAWTNKAGGFSEQINPTFISPSIFLPIPTLPDSKRIIIPMFLARRNFTTTRFLFSASSLEALKKKAGPSSTRVKAVVGLIWKCAIDASRKLRSSTSKHHVMIFPIDMRFRSSPPFPPYSIGNIIFLAGSLCARDDDSGLHNLVRIIKNTIDEFDSEFIEKLKGEEGSPNLKRLLKDDENLRNKDIEITLMTSVCNGGMYEAADFGWGKPIWVSVGLGEPFVSYMESFVILMDTKSGDGIEAWVTSSVEKMTILEQDPELLSFASLNSSPLEN